MSENEMDVNDQKDSTETATQATGTPSEKTVEEDVYVGAFDRLAWEWRAQEFARDTYKRRSYSRCREAGLDFNVGSSKEPKLNKSDLTNGVILDISDLCKDIVRTQMHVICSILENNFELGLENDQQRYEYTTRIMIRVNELKKKKKTSQVFGCELFELPSLNFKHLSQHARTLSLNDSLSSRRQHVQMEPASPAGTINGTLLPEPSEPLFIKTEPASCTIDGTLLPKPSEPLFIKTEPASCMIDGTLLPEPSEPWFIKLEPASCTRIDGTLLPEPSEPPFIKTEPASCAMDGTLVPEPSEPFFIKLEPASCTRMDGTLLPEPSEPPFVKTEPASCTRMNETLLSEPSKPPFIKTEPATASKPPTTEKLKDLYPLCWEIGLDLRARPKCWKGEEHKLHSLLLTNNVMMEIASFTKEVCGSTRGNKQMMFELLKHNFDLDIEKLNLCHIFTERLNKAKVRRKLYPRTSEWNKDKINEFRDQPFVLLPSAKLKKTDKEKPGVLPSKSPRLKEVTEGRRLALKRKQEVDLQKEQKEKKQKEQAKQERKAIISKKKQEKLERSKTLAIQEAYAMMFDQEGGLSFSYPPMKTGFGGQATSPIEVDSSSSDVEEINMMSATNETLNDEPWAFFRLQSDTQATENQPTENHSKKNPPDPIKQLHMCNKLVRAVLGDTVEHEEMISRLAAMFWDGTASEVLLKEILTEYRSEILPLTVKEYGGLSDSEKTTVAQDNQLFCGLQLIDGWAHQAQTTLLLWDKIVFGESDVAACHLEAAGLESGTVRLIRTVSDTAQRQGFTENGELVTFKNFLLDRGEFDDMPLTSPRGGRIDGLFQDGALVYSILDDMREFTRDHVDEGGHLKSVAADVEVAHFRAGIRALGLLSKLVIDPLLKAITSKGSMLEMEGRYETLVAKLEKWQQNSRDLVEGRACLYEDIEVPKDLVFDKLTSWTDSDFYELTIQILELLLATFLVLCRRMQPEDEELELLTGSLTKGLGGVEQLHRARMHASSIAIESMITLKTKRSWEWLSSLDKQKRLI